MTNIWRWSIIEQDSPCGCFLKLMNFAEKTKTYFKEVKVEMAKVKWPTRNETINYTMVVIGVSAAVAAFLGAMDYFFSLGLNLWLFK